jgi:hypothetical protein
MKGITVQTLWELVKQIIATNISSVFAQLAQLAQVTSTSPQDENVPVEFLRGRIGVFVLQATLVCAELNLAESLGAARRLQADVNGDAPVSNQELLWKLESLRVLMESEMGKQLYFRVEERVTRYVNRRDAFGAEVKTAFPSIEIDLVEAGNCIAFGCNAAAILHLMKVAEIGMWELGRDRQIPVAKSGTITCCEWGDIINQLEAALKVIQGTWPKSPSKSEAQTFYNHAIEELRAFNGGYRRDAAHARPGMLPPTPEDALAAWGHVERFMRVLATKIGEGTYTSLVW